MNCGYLVVLEVDIFLFGDLIVGVGLYLCGFVVVIFVWVKLF